MSNVPMSLRRFALSFELKAYDSGEDIQRISILGIINLPMPQCRGMHVLRSSRMCVHTLCGKDVFVNLIMSPGRRHVLSVHALLTGIDCYFCKQ